MSTVRGEPHGQVYTLLARRALIRTVWSHKARIAHDAWRERVFLNLAFGAWNAVARVASSLILVGGVALCIYLHCPRQQLILVSLSPIDGNKLCASERGAEPHKYATMHCGHRNNVV